MTANVPAGVHKQEHTAKQRVSGESQHRGDQVNNTSGGRLVDNARNGVAP